MSICNDGNLTIRPHGYASHEYFTPSLRIANAAAVLDGPYDAISRQTALSGLSRQALYRDALCVVQAVDGCRDRQQRLLAQDNDHLLRRNNWQSCRCLWRCGRRRCARKVCGSVPKG